MIKESNRAFAQAYIQERVEIDEETGCWEWQPFKDRNGYGQGSIKGKVHYAHRISYAAFNGPIEGSDICVCHTCDNPPCCNPEHLWLGTRGDNMDDCLAKGRHVQASMTKCRNGHEYTDENIYIGTSGGRECRVCRKEYMHSYHESNSEKANFRAKSYYEDNKEKVRAQKKERYQSNREEILKRNRAYRGTVDKKELSAKNKIWRERNKERIKAQRKAQREAKKIEFNALSEEERESIREKRRAWERARYAANTEKMRAKQRARYATKKAFMVAEES